MSNGETQRSLLGFTEYTVDAIGWTAIRMAFVRRDLSEGTIENTGAVTVQLRTLDTDAAHERSLESGNSLVFKGGEPRGQLFAPDAPICYAKAASGTCTLMVTER